MGRATGAATLLTWGKETEKTHWFIILLKIQWIVLRGTK